MWKKYISGWEIYLEVPLQSRDVLTAHLHIIQSHLRQKEPEGLSRSTTFLVFPSRKLSADLNSTKQTSQEAFLIRSFQKSKQ